jgi:hypothetical protein
MSKWRQRNNENISGVKAAKMAGNVGEESHRGVMKR